MIALVTGGTGFLGRQVVSRLAAEGVDVRCLLRGTSQVDDLKRVVGKDHWHRVEIVRAELGDPSSYRSHLAGVDVVYHLAAGMTGGASVLFLNTVVPTRTFVTACADAKVPRFVLVSSLGVYGAGALQPWSTLDEACPVDSTPHLRDAYSFSKIVQENVCREIAVKAGLPLVIIRPGVVFGPGKGALSTRVGLTIGGLTLRIGSARQLPYTYVDNCAAAICLAGQSAKAVGETINILDDDLPSVRSVLAAYRKHGKKLRSIWLPQRAIGPLSSLYGWYHRYSRGQVPEVITRYRTDTFWRPLRFTNAKAKHLLAWTPHVSMACALERSISSTRSQAT